ncbi:hypothetical protein DLAC_04467 [Tieghemostelium lacteum]|uniref:FAD-binding PCMH-type domain-containing protein n=1 Tax=Tieghemostelium lacteum TaxID=361077 RepID=A0A151ZJQ1_TIELA|nr:hypothetical protein DLAC_04467 [Tieghemostelium lacteum]|eukprot:KYQ94176.1 hypothetical protein DLAC_04467 [Tieghemostelium lacteum]
MNTDTRNMEMKIVSRDDSEYREYFQNYNSRIQRNPYCYVIPRSEIQCKEALKYAQSLGKKVSVRSGGHSCIGMSVLDDRVSIDLREMNDIQLNVSDKTITVQSGVLLKDFYETTTKYNLATAGGGCPTVCIGGLTLGGGSNYLSSSYGYVIDNVLEARVLLANGTIVNCSRNGEYSDLFWAIRGAGHAGFGIVLQFKLQLYEISPLVFYQFLVIPFSDFEVSLERLLLYSRTDRNADVHLTFECRKTYKNISSDPTLKIIFFYNGPAERGEVLFQDFHQNVLKGVGRTMKDFQSHKSFMDIIRLGPNPELIRRSFTKNRLVFGSDLNRDRIKQLKSHMTSDIVMGDVNNRWPIFDNQTNFSIVLYYHGGKQNQVPPTDCAFIHRECDWSLVGICSYVQPENDQLFSQWTDRVQNQFSEISSSIYQNYPDDDPNIDWRQAYYGSNYPRLQQIKLKYDPNNYFSHFQSIELPSHPKSNL